MPVAICTPVGFVGGGGVKGWWMVSSIDPSKWTHTHTPAHPGGTYVPASTVISPVPVKSAATVK